MTSRALVLAALIAMALSAPANAAAPSSDARAAARSGIRTPVAKIIQAPCPDMDPHATSEACSYPDGRIYLPAGMSEFQRQHELGHLFDAQYLSRPGRRERATRLLGFKVGTPWDNGTGTGGFDSPAELSADAYAACRLRLDPDRRWETSYDYMPSRKEFRAMCGFLRRAGH